MINSQSAIGIHGLSKSYASAQAVDDLSFKRRSLRNRAFES
jgi:hypothetical protein